MNEQNPENRVTLIEDRVFLVRELANPTPETISQSARYIRDMSQEWEKFSIMVEFQGQVLPSASVRHRVAEEMLSIKSKLAHVAVITNKNVVLTVAIRFIGTFSGYESISVHQTREDALKAVLKRLSA